MARRCVLATIPPTVTDVPAVGGGGGGGGGAGDDLFGGAGGGAPAGGQPSLGDFFSDQPQAPGPQPGANPYSAPQPESYSPFAGGAIAQDSTPAFDATRSHPR